MLYVSGGTDEATMVYMVWDSMKLTNNPLHLHDKYKL